MGFLLRQNKNVKNCQKLEDVLAINLKKLMDAHPLLNTDVAVEEKTAKGRFSKVGRSTVQRIRNAEVSTRLESINAIAEAFCIKPTELLKEDAQGDERGALGDLSDFESAIVLLIRALPEEKRLPLVKRMNQLLIANSNESKLLDLFEQSTVGGRDLILTTADTAPKRSDEAGGILGGRKN